MPRSCMQVAGHLQQQQWLWKAQTPSSRWCRGHSCLGDSCAGCCWDKNLTLCLGSRVLVQNIAHFPPFLNGHASHTTSYVEIILIACQIADVVGTDSIVCNWWPAGGGSCMCIAVEPPGIWPSFYQPTYWNINCPVSSYAIQVSHEVAVRPGTIARTAPDNAAAAPSASIFSSWAFSLSMLWWVFWVPSMSW